MIVYPYPQWIYFDNSVLRTTNNCGSLNAKTNISYTSHTHILVNIFITILITNG